MKTTILLALAVAAGASFFPATAEAKAKKGKKKAEVTLTTTLDSLSYAAGLEATRNFEAFLKNQFKGDEKKLAAFYRGFQEAMAREYSDDMTAYSLGLSFPQRLRESNFKYISEEAAAELDFNLFMSGFAAGMDNDTLRMGRQEAAHRMVAGREAGLARRTKEAEAFMAQHKAEEGVKTTASGLQYKVVRAGSGATAKATDEVEVKYEGRLPDGTVFDSSDRQPTKSATFQPSKLIKGWCEALTMMPEGSVWEICVPFNLGYGTRKVGKIPPCSPLLFTLEVVKVTEKKAPEHKIQYSPVVPGEMKPMKGALQEKAVKK
jgi:FKBP-type peptidyl-prolyl cis-trans isomerase FklB